LIPRGTLVAAALSAVNNLMNLQGIVSAVAHASRALHYPAAYFAGWPRNRHATAFLNIVEARPEARPKSLSFEPVARLVLQRAFGRTFLATGGNPPPSVEIAR
jgi:hypothetical protein